MELNDKKVANRNKNIDPKINFLYRFHKFTEHCKIFRGLCKPCKRETYISGGEGRFEFNSFMSKIKQLFPNK